jgi:acetyl-CoA synthetase (ADP-forming)
MDIVKRAVNEGRSALSEFEAKQVLSSYGIPVTKHFLMERPEELDKAVGVVGFPLVMKGCSAEIAHKTEKGLIRLDIRSRDEAGKAYSELSRNMPHGKGSVLVEEMVKGSRELVAGMTRDPQFGPCVMFGLGGIFTEILRDVAFRKAPFEKIDAFEMMDDIKGNKILGPIRGMPEADREALADMLIRMGQIGLDVPEIKEIDANPVILDKQGRPVAVDALIVLG